MSTDAHSTRAPARPLTWREASRLSRLHWPAYIAIGGLASMTVNLIMGTDAFYRLGAYGMPKFSLFGLFLGLFIITVPIWVVSTSRRQCRLPVPVPGRQSAAAAALTVLAFLVTPTIGIQHRQFSEEQEYSTIWGKRSLVETMKRPRLAYDELSQNTSYHAADSVPKHHLCPGLSVRLVPFFGFERDYRIGSDVFGPQNGPFPSLPSRERIDAVVARCRSEAQLMLAAGLTAEAALKAGDVDTFFARALLARPANKAILLEDRDIPPALLAKVESFLAEHPLKLGYQDDAHNAGEVRRLRPAVIAAALGRSREEGLLKAGSH